MPQNLTSDPIKLDKISNPKIFKQHWWGLKLEGQLEGNPLAFEYFQPSVGLRRFCVVFLCFILGTVNYQPLYSPRLLTDMVDLLAMNLMDTRTTKSLRCCDMEKKRHKSQQIIIDRHIVTFTWLPLIHMLKMLVYVCQKYFLWVSYYIQHKML